MCKSFNYNLNFFLLRTFTLTSYFYLNILLFQSKILTACWHPSDNVKPVPPERMASDTPAGPSDQSKKLNYTTSSGQPSTNNTKQVQVLSAGHKKLKKEDRSHSNMGSFESDIKRKILGRFDFKIAFDYLTSSPKAPCKPRTPF